MIFPLTNLPLEDMENDQQGQVTQYLQQNTCSSFNCVPRLIKYTSQISLFTSKISSSKTDVNVHTVLVRRNGSPYLVPQQCKEYFSNIIFKSERIDYFLKSYKQYFKLCFNISIPSQEPVSIQNTFLIGQVQTILKKSEKYLILAGLLKSQSKISLINIKNSLKLKKEFVQALLQKNHQSSFQQTPKNQQSPEVIDIEVVQIQEKHQNSDERELKTRKGGYFIVQEKICKITKSDGQSSQMVLAKKQIKDHKKQRTEHVKLLKQLQFVRRIRNKKYLLNYYLGTNDQNCFYMDFVAQSLKDLVHGKTLRMCQKFDLAHQLIQAVSILHESNIVHRDLKLENILVDVIGEMRLKIIDFGESQFIGKTSKNSNLGCTPPYSPLECLLGIEDQSYDRPEIDYWSLVIIIYELTFKSLPLYYNRSIQLQLINGWRNEGDFCIFLRHRARKGFWKIEEMLNLFTEQGLRINQCQRLNLVQMFGIMKAIEGYYQRLKQLL